MLTSWQLQLARYGASLGVLIGAAGSSLRSGGPLTPILWALGFLLIGIASAMKAVNWRGVTDRIVANSDHFWGLSRDREFALQRSIGRVGVVLALAGITLAAALETIHPRR